MASPPRSIITWRAASHRRCSLSTMLSSTSSGSWSVRAQYTPRIWSCSSPSGSPIAAANFRFRSAASALAKSTFCLPTPWTTATAIFLAMPAPFRSVPCGHAGRLDIIRPQRRHRSVTRDRRPADGTMWGMSPRQVLLLSMGVVAVSFSAILIREAHANGLVIAFYRNALSAAVVLPGALLVRRDELRRLTRRQVGLAALSGAVLAAHFALWIPSVQYTTVAASVTLVTASPIFV